MASIDASRKDLVEEFRKTPVGHQSVELQKMMSVMRGERFPGKHVLICTKPFNVSKITDNVLRRFLDSAPFQAKA